jgi:hypothetical protein
VSQSQANGDVKTVIIPTGTKAKISHELSFPIGAERISLALASTSQLPQLVLHFRRDYFNGVRFGRYPFLRVHYSRREKPSDLLSPPVASLFSEWQIWVWPVPRILRHHIQQYIVDSGLPRIKQWLDHHVNLAQPGSESLTFLFDEKKEEFVTERGSRLQPAQGVQPRELKATGSRNPTAKPKKERSRP